MLEKAEDSSGSVSEIEAFAVIGVTKDTNDKQELADEVNEKPARAINSI